MCMELVGFFIYLFIFLRGGGWLLCMCFDIIVIVYSFLFFFHEMLLLFRTFELPRMERVHKKCYKLLLSLLLYRLRKCSYRQAIGKSKVILAVTVERSAQTTCVVPILVRNDNFNRSFAIPLDGKLETGRQYLQMQNLTLIM